MMRNPKKAHSLRVYDARSRKGSWPLALCVLEAPMCVPVLWALNTSCSEHGFT